MLKVFAEKLKLSEQDNQRASEKSPTTAPAAHAARQGNASLMEAIGKHTSALLQDETEEQKVTDKDWDAIKHRLGQQDLMIKAMIEIFTNLNGAVVIMVFVFWIGDLICKSCTPVISEKVVLSIVGATVIQSGVAFMSITKFLFPDTPQNQQK